ncbi:hypothetical protein [Leptolyngbya sp. KIOST-1]|uniref:hypothetical protein n=1 Tax=Leptolyngbya sp. KIOST-1 TaxID=1229172 RepID=UPI000565EA60|nr:hypothetical protein [Leptolyngbya sp. KIOST-1]
MCNSTTGFLQITWQQVQAQINGLALIDFFQMAESLAVMAGLIIAVRTYLYQAKQARIGNSFSLIDSFTRNIKRSDIEVLEEIARSTYDGIYGLEPGCFLAYSHQKRKAVNYPLRDLFVPEGRGCYLDACFNDDDLSQEAFAVEVGISPVRDIAEELNIIAYEVLKGGIDIRIVNYELGHLITTMCNLLDSVIYYNPEDLLGIRSIKDRFGYLLELRDLLDKKRLPQKSFANMS